MTTGRRSKLKRKTWTTTSMSSSTQSLKHTIAPGSRQELESGATVTSTAPHGRCVPRDGGAVLTQIVGVRGVTSAVLTQNVGVRGVAWLLSL
jgi:hypothetical protein